MTSLTLVRHIKARPSIVFDALTTPEGIACWWGPDGGPVLVAETDPRVGGRFRVRFRMLDGSEHESSGEYLEVVGPERLAVLHRRKRSKGVKEVPNFFAAMQAVDQPLEPLFCGEVPVWPYVEVVEDELFWP